MCLMYARYYYYYDDGGDDDDDVRGEYNWE